MGCGSSSGPTQEKQYEPTDCFETNLVRLENVRSLVVSTRDWYNNATEQNPKYAISAYILFKAIESKLVSQLSCDLNDYLRDTVIGDSKRRPLYSKDASNTLAVAQLNTILNDIDMLMWYGARN
jgi:hypothetical protein